MSTCTATPKRPTASRSASSTRIGRTSTYSPPLPSSPACLPPHRIARGLWLHATWPPSHAEPAWRVHAVRALRTGVGGYAWRAGARYRRSRGCGRMRCTGTNRCAGYARTRGQAQHAAPTKWHCFSALPCYVRCREQGCSRRRARRTTRGSRYESPLLAQLQTVFMQQPPSHCRFGCACHVGPRSCRTRRRGYNVSAAATA